MESLHTMIASLRRELGAYEDALEEIAGAESLSHAKEVASTALDLPLEAPLRITGWGFMLKREEDS